MVKFRELSMEERNKIIKLHEKGIKPFIIVEKTHFKKSTVRNVIKKWTTTGSVANRQRRGRPRATTTREDRKIVQLAQGDRRITLDKLTKSAQNDHKIIVSRGTIKRRLHEVNLRGRRARKKPLLSKNNIARRLKWAKDHAAWTTKDWGKVLWSD